MRCWPLAMASSGQQLGVRYGGKEWQSKFLTKKGVQWWKLRMEQVCFTGVGVGEHQGALLSKTSHRGVGAGEDGAKTVSQLA